LSIYRRPKSGVAAGDAIPFASGDEFHLFHLSSPADTSAFPQRVRTTWEHARSRDLVAWEELPAALLPGEGDEPDADGAWTGSLIKVENVFHLFYTGHKLGAENPQTICHATSSDLIHFEKNPANPILRPTSQFESIDWRDPFLLWNDEEQLYWMLIAARLREGPKWRRGCIALATSPDLEMWTVEEEPFYAPMTTFCPECPEMFALGKHWYLVYSRFSEDAATLYRLADNSRGPWRVPERETFDGRRWYAAKSMPIREDARAFFGWVHDREGASDTGSWLWGGDFTAPREVTATASGELRAALPKQVAAAFHRPLGFSVTGPLSDDHEQGKATSLHLGEAGRFDWRILGIESSDFMLDCVFRSDQPPASFGLLLRLDDDLACHALVWDRRRRSVSLMRWPAPLDSFWADLVGRSREIREVDGPRLVEHELDWDLRGEGVSCRLISSGSLVEIYVNQSVAISYRIYEESNGFGVFAEDGAISCASIAVSQLTHSE
jgi:beta-fructofuranosidase